MVIQINVKDPEKFEQGDMLVYAGSEKFEVVKKADLLKPLEQKIAKLEEEISFLKDQATLVKNKTNKKIKGFLQAFVKEIK